MLTDQPMPIKMIYLYHWADEFIFNSLCDQLVGLRINNLISDEGYEPLAGNDFYQLKARLEMAQIIILLISKDFHADKRFHKPEMVAAIKECAEKGVRIWPILARYIFWESSIFKEYELFSGVKQSITENPENVFKKIIPRIHQEIHQIHSDMWVQDGDIYCHQMRFDDAKFAYQKSLSYTPDYPPALLGMGHVFSKCGQLEEAKQLFNKIKSYDKQAKQQEKNTSYFDIQRTDFTNDCCKGYALLELGRPNEALAAFQEVHQQNASPINSMQRSFYAQAYCGEGDAHVKIGNQYLDLTIYYKALEAYNKAKELVPDNPKYLNKIGDIYTILAALSVSNYSYEQAIDIYQEINNRFPNDACAYVGRGNALRNLNRFQEALVAYEKALKLDQYEAGGYGGKGEVLLALDRPKDALSAFEEALCLDKDNADYYYGKGQTLAKLSRHQEALNAYDQACTCGFESLSLLVHRAMSLLELAEAERTWGLHGMALCYYKKAQEDYNYTLGQVWSEKDVVLCGLGKIAFAYCGNWDQAFQYYQRAVNFAPNKANAYFEMGKLFIERKNYSEAFKYFEYARERCNHATSTLDEADIETAYGDTYFHIAEKLDPKDSYKYVSSQKLGVEQTDYPDKPRSEVPSLLDNPDPQTMLPQDIEKIHKYLSQAREHYQKAVDTRCHAMAYVGLGKTCAKLHCNKEAINALDFAIKQNPSFAECYFLKGNSCYELGRYEEASYLYKDAIGLGFNKAAVHNALGDTQLAMKRYFDALATFNDVIEHIKEDLAHAYCGRGIALHALGNCEEALYSFEKASHLDNIICLKPPYIYTIQDIGSSFEGRLRANPEDTSAYKHKGDVSLLLGERINDAIDAYTKAIERGDRSADVYYCRGEAYYRQHEYHRSLRDYSKALAIDPNYLPAQLGKKKVRSMMEQSSGHHIKSFAAWVITRVDPTSVVQKVLKQR